MGSIKEVAQYAGVSVRTVSRYLNGYEGISRKTRDKIESAMATLQFAPSAAAQSLRGRGDAVIGLVTESVTTTPYAYELVSGVQHVCNENQAMLLISEISGSDESITRAVQDFRRHRCSAILYATNHRKQVALPIEVNDTPLVLVNCHEEQFDRFPTVLPNDEQGAYLLTRELLLRNHRHIAFLTLSAGIAATQIRNSGFRRAHVELGVTADPRYTRVGVIDHDDEQIIGTEFDELERHIDELMALSPQPTAIMFGNDKMAMRAYMIVRGRLGYQIPQDVSVAGYDNYELIAENLVPGLTTVNLPYRDMGSKGAQLAIDANRDPRRYLVDSIPVIRGSVAALDEIVSESGVSALGSATSGNVVPIQS